MLNGSFRTLLTERGWFTQRTLPTAIRRDHWWLLDIVELVKAVKGDQFGASQDAKLLMQLLFVVNLKNSSGSVSTSIKRHNSNEDGQPLRGSATMMAHPPALTEPRHPAWHAVSGWRPEDYMDKTKRLVLSIRRWSICFAMQMLF